MHQKVTAALMSSKKNELVLSWKMHKKFMNLFRKCCAELQQWTATWTKPNQELNLSPLGFCKSIRNFKGRVRGTKPSANALALGTIGTQGWSTPGPAGRRGWNSLKPAWCQEFITHLFCLDFMFHYRLQKIWFLSIYYEINKRVYKAVL